MARGIERRPMPVAHGFAYGAIAALVAAWLWNRRGETALHRRTAERLRSLSGKHTT